MRPAAIRDRSEHARWALASCLVVTGCIEPRIAFPPAPSDDDEEDEPPPIDDREVVVSEVPPPPIFGGTLTVIPEAAVAVVSDPDRDLVIWVDLDAFEVVRAVPVAAGAWPWRAVADDGLVHVVLRGAGRVISLDVADGTVVHERTVCADPRGLDVRPSDGAVIVACARGELRALPADGGAAETIATIDADLRDVIAYPDGTLAVSRFRSTTILMLDAGGTVVEELRPDYWRARTNAEGLDFMRPHTAWRTVPTPDEGWLMVHQAASDRVLAAPPEDDGGPVVGYYEGPGTDCSTVVQSGLSRYSRQGGLSSTGPIARVVLPVDVAVSPDGNWAGVASAATTPEGGHLHAVLVDLDDLAVESEPPCHEPIEIELPDDDAQVVALAFDSMSRLLVQTREPARLYRVDNYDIERIQELTLTTLPRFDTGHQTFHEDPGTSITCASCHPEGGDDGHVWRFAERGPRHTPSLEATLQGTEPFHWSGELPDFAALVDDVLVRRMGGTMPNAERTAALEQWMYTIARERVVAPDDAAERGAAAWATFECGACHTGDTLTNNGFARINTYELIQVPSLHAVSLHPPYMHDGHAPTLEDAVREMIVATAPAMAVSEEQIADLVAHVRGL